MGMKLLHNIHLEDLRHIINCGISKKDSAAGLLVAKEQQLTLKLSKEALGTGVDILRLLTSNPLFICFK